MRDLIELPDLNRIGRPIGCVVSSSWISADNDWRCPVCKRSKYECLRISERGVLLGKIVLHHDHVLDLSWDTNASGLGTISAGLAARELLKALQFFNDVEICEDCNVADGAAKKKLKLCRFFTYPPMAIRRFIRPTNNGLHLVDYDKAAECFGELRERHEARMQVAQMILQSYRASAA